MQHRNAAAQTPAAATTNATAIGNRLIAAPEVIESGPAAATAAKEVAQDANPMQTLPRVVLSGAQSEGVVSVRSGCR